MSWHVLCAAQDIPSGQGREFVVGGRVVAVFHAAERWFAIDGMCAHQGGPLAQGKLDGRCLTCPWHGWQYDISSGENLLTGKRMLDCFAVEERDGEIWVEVAESPA